MAQIYYYDPQSAGINMQSSQSDSTFRKLTLKQGQDLPLCIMYIQGLLELDGPHSEYIL